MIRHAFRGGIHPPDNKNLTEDKPFSNLSIPQICYIPMQQHTGKPARVCVAVGDNVTQGQKIGEADGFISAHVHASIPGRVVEIARHPTVYARDTECVVIELQGSFSSSHENDSLHWESYSKEEIVAKVLSAGLTGLGGAAFPTHVKLQPPHDKPIDTLIVNGSECEPYLTVDDMLMRSHAARILTGIRMTMKALGVGRAVIGVEDNKPAALQALRTALKESAPSEGIQVKPLRTRFPQGAEKQLIHGILKRTVPSGGLPMDAGAVVQNVGTIFAIYEAVMFDKPLFERYITVTGKCVKNPGNYKVHIGTRILDILEECGGLTEDPAKIIMGGPMCGVTLDSLDVPIVKGTSGLLFMSRGEAVPEEYRACIRCGRCVAACPMGLLPNELGNAVEHDRFETAEALRPFDCIMCGSCAYSCPARRPLNHFIKVAQDKLRHRIRT
jgi:Na+-translocating ferredoxin:NAD+ oxidoreductase subunit C